MVESIGNGVNEKPNVFSRIREMVEMPQESQGKPQGKPQGNHGGARPGSGRKPIGKQRAFVASDDQWQAYHDAAAAAGIGRGEWMRRELDRAAESLQTAQSAQRAQSGQSKSRRKRRS